MSTENLFVACRKHDALAAKRLPLDAAVQEGVADLFKSQELSFLAGIKNEVLFTESISCDEDEILTIRVPSEALVFEETVSANSVSIPEFAISKLQDEPIKAIFTASTQSRQNRVLIQSFSISQVLGRKFSLFHKNNTFTRITEPGLTIGTQLTCIIEEGWVKFKSPSKLRSIIDINDIYREATEPEMRCFAGHNNLLIPNIDDFLESANTVTRKLIHEIQSSRILDQYSPIKIQSAARKTGLKIRIENGKIVMPSTQKEIKSLLQFLNESRYAGPLSGNKYLANSKRPAK